MRHNTTAMRRLQYGGVAAHPKDISTC
eukprot:COSAG06_NODE_67781_length_251_cov_0.664474_1_plen_26_part_10